jgi:formylglycine-generating enzyme required for sulfatase activity
MRAPQHRIFLSYRRDDTGDASGRIYDRLTAALGAKAVFKDVDRLIPGVEFGTHILDVLRSCEICLVLIGPNWTEVRDKQGRRRLDDVNDWVRVELEAAFKAPTVHVVPVLVNDARLPERECLPESLHPILSRNVATIRRDPDFHRDMDRLIQALEALGEGRREAVRVKSPIVPAGFRLPEMVSIKGGEFEMGAPPEEKGSSGNERPQHLVCIDYDFELGMYPVTFSDWESARSAGAELLRLNRRGARDGHPAVNISWCDAQAYVAFLNATCAATGQCEAYRLPSEAEWEYACRAGTTTAYWTGNSIGASQACMTGKGAIVGSYPPNALGLYDMTGNVWEWCEDIWHDNYEGAPIDGSAWLATPDKNERRVRRGGCWSGYLPQDLRSASRSGIDPAQRSFDTGLRVARTLSQDLVSFR